MAVGPRVLSLPRTPTTQPDACDPPIAILIDNFRHFLPMAVVNALSCCPRPGCAVKSAAARMQAHAQIAAGTAAVEKLSFARYSFSLRRTFRGAILRPVRTPEKAKVDSPAGRTRRARAGLPLRQAAPMLSRCEVEFSRRHLPAHRVAGTFARPTAPLRVAFNSSVACVGTTPATHLCGSILTRQNGRSEPLYCTLPGARRSASTAAVVREAAPAMPQASPVPRRARGARGGGGARGGAGDARSRGAAVGAAVAAVGAAASVAAAEKDARATRGISDDPSHEYEACEAIGDGLRGEFWKAKVRKRCHAARRPARATDAPARSTRISRCWSWTTSRCRCC